jgi:hypothetical protein
VNVSGSVAVTPNNNPASNRVNATAPIKPAPTPTSASLIPCDQSLNSAGPCAERHTNADLVRALGYGVRDHAINPDCGQQQRNQGKQAKQQSPIAGRADGFGYHPAPSF